METAENIYWAEPLESEGLLDSSSEYIPLEIERPTSLLRVVIEVLFYLTVMMVVFPSWFRVEQLRFVLAGSILSVGLLSVMMFLVERQALPISIWFAMLVNIGANISEVVGHQHTPILTRGLTELFHWIWYLAMVCYLVQNAGAAKRILLFFSGMVIAAVLAGGITFYGERLSLEVGIGRSFRNANQVAYLSGLFAVACLFWSLRANIVLRPVLWVISAVLVWALFGTVSRAGIAVFGCGLIVLAVAIAMGRGVRLGGIILIVVAIIAIFQLGYLLARPLYLLEERLTYEPIHGGVRMRVYSVGTLYDLWDSKVLGGGLGTITRSAGITAHNSFVYTHMCYGGITAWPYAIWLLVLAVRILRMMRLSDVPRDLKFLVIALFGMALGSQAFSNRAYLFFSCIYATAIIEKYTAPFSKRRMRASIAAERGYSVEEPEFALASDTSSAG
jgi:hypothetical protein